MWPLGCLAIRHRGLKRSEAKREWENYPHPARIWCRAGTCPQRWKRTEQAQVELAVPGRGGRTVAGLGPSSLDLCEVPQQHRGQLGWGWGARPLPSDEMMLMGMRTQAVRPRGTLYRVRVFLQKVNLYPVVFGSWYHGGLFLHVLWGGL